MREIVTTALDTLGILLIAAGAGFVVAPFIGFAGLAVAGLVVLGGSALASRLDRTERPQ